MCDEESRLGQGTLMFALTVIELTNLDTQSPKHEATETPFYVFAGGDKYSFTPSQACYELITLLKSLRIPAPDRTKADGPLIILAFDETHTLTKQKTPTQRSNLGELEHVLRALRRFPCFSLFTSTTEQIAETSQKPDPSARIFFEVYRPVQPFTDLGFDTLARKVSLDGSCDLGELTSTFHMAHLGRPLCV
jgi:hypothetical protein